jgi:hypothetical protein
MVVSGACISGQVRTNLPCVGERMRDNILVPLNLRTHVFLHGKNISEHDVRKTLHGAEVKTVVVMRPQAPTPPCPTRVPGYPLTRFLFLCYRALMKDSVEYEWVVRLRSDQNIPFTFRILPPASTYYKLHPWATGIMISSFLSDCNCGWKKRKCLSKIPTRCEWVDDQFALLHGSAVKSYFHDLHVSFCNPGFFNVASQYSLSLTLPEKRLSLALHNVSLHDIRFISLALHPQLQRSGDCNVSGDGARHRQRLTTVINVSDRSFQLPLPDGPWDQRRMEICGTSRAMDTWARHLCLPYDGTWDDELTKSHDS